MKNAKRRGEGIVKKKKKSLGQQKQTYTAMLTKGPP